MSTSSERDEQLARSGVAAGKRDADGEWLERTGRRLAAKGLAAGPAESIAAGIAELRDEAGHDAMDDDAIVEAIARELGKAGHGDGGHRRVERELELPRVGFERELHFRGGQVLELCGGSSGRGRLAGRLRALQERQRARRMLAHRGVLVRAIRFDLRKRAREVRGAGGFDEIAHRFDVVGSERPLERRCEPVRDVPVDRFVAAADAIGVGDDELGRGRDEPGLLGGERFGDDGGGVLDLGMPSHELDRSFANADVR